MRTVPLVVYGDPLLETLTFLRARLPARTESYVQGITMGMRIPERGKTLPYLLVRRVGGFLSGSGIDKARIDLHCYHDGEFRAQQLAQIVRGLVMQMPSTRTVAVYGAREFSGPGPAPDPFWPEATRYYFTVELTMRAIELPA